MAKYETKLRGDLKGFVSFLHDGILQGSATASYEGGSDYTANGVRCVTCVYERFSYLGNNRVSLNIMLVENDDEIFLSAITSGGSQAMFFKMNTVGEENFLDVAVRVIEEYKSRNT